MKKAYLISCTNHYKDRICVVDEALKELGYETVYITSDFDHTKKETFECDIEGCVQIHARTYKKNLSLHRILSHFFLTRDIFSFIEKSGTDPDLIYCEIPPNFLAYFGAKYKKKHRKVKMIFDIFDLWPETFPSGKVKKILAPIFSVWGFIRNHALPWADFVICECEMFKNKLGLCENSRAIYLCQNSIEDRLLNPELPKDKINLCYLGSINNIISISNIEVIIKEISKKKPVTLHIIGAGEKQDELIAATKNAGAEVVFHGPVFDNDKKQEIMSCCHFGLNIMKESVCVGLTMKSVDYFCHGLPIINNIPADTKRLVLQNEIGVNFDDENFLAKVLCGNEKYLEMRENVKKTFDGVFEKKIIFKEFKEIIENITQIDKGVIQQ